MSEFSGEGRRIPGSECPRCGDILEYNGNYWCASEGCPWVLPDPCTGRDQDAFELAYILLMKQTGRVDQIQYSAFHIPRKERVR